MISMKVSGFLAFTILSISILSFGLTGAVNAQSQTVLDGSNLPLSVSTESDTYTTGNSIVISGAIKNISENKQDVIIIVSNPIGNFVKINQISHDDLGNYSMTFSSGGPYMTASGEYKIQASYGAQKITSTFQFIAGDTPVKVTPIPVAEPTPEPVVEQVAEPTPEPVAEPTPEPVVEQVVNCGPGTESVNGVCQVVQTTTQESEEGGGCLIATAAYGSEMSPQVQLLREIRDNQLMNTESGTAFMSGFNELYYSFSPTIADMERESPIFKEIVKVGLTPMLSSLAIMESANSESEVLGLGLSVIALNLGMYIAAPTLIGMKVHKEIKSRK
jgi:hypothetical protein